MSVSDLQDCGHTGDLGGICQFEACAKQLCSNCVADCEVCGRTLCSAHREELDCAPGAVFCQPDKKEYLKNGLLRMGGSAVADRLFGGRRR